MCARAFAGPLLTHFNSPGSYEKGSAAVSWETCAGNILGNKFYTLLIADIFSWPFVLFGTAIFKWYFVKNKERFEPDTVSVILAVVKRQGLVFAGQPFCPFLPCIAIVGNVMLFYAHSLVLSWTGKPPEKRWVQSRHNSVFSSLLLMSLVILFAPLSLIFVE